MYGYGLWTEADDEQYVAWVADNDHYVVAKRAHDSETWSQVVDLVGKHPIGTATQDDHNMSAVGVDTDGIVHLTGNMHNVALKYSRSTSAGDLSAWSGGAAGATMVGSDEASVAYPFFLRNNAGTAAGDELLFGYRDGNSGFGDLMLNAYDEATHTWSRRAKVINGKANNVSAYLNGIHVDGTGRLWVVWNWRTTDDEQTGYDILGAYSDDNGATWYKLDGTLHTAPITTATAYRIAIVVAGNGFKGQPGFGVRNGELHIGAVWNVSGESQIHHIYWNGSAWAVAQVTSDAGLKQRPQIIATDDVLWLTYIDTDGSLVKLDLLTSNTAPTSTVLHADTMSQWDRRAARLRDELHFLNDFNRPGKITVLELT